jgi:hypothetical protein
VHSVMRIEAGNYETGMAKLEQLEALLLLTSSDGCAAFGRLIAPAQMNLAVLAYELALGSRCALSDTVPSQHSG